MFGEEFFENRIQLRVENATRQLGSAGFKLKSGSIHVFRRAIERVLQFFVLLLKPFACIIQFTELHI